MTQHNAAALSIDGPWIEIRGGRTRFPQRPIPGDRLLIGSGSNCDLQLGGHVPMAHSVIHQTVDGWRIDALVAEPPLKVRGEIVRQATLLDGDAIQIGPFSLIAHLRPIAQAALLAPIDVTATVAEASANASFATALSSLSAAELLDGLTTEFTAAAAAASGPSIGELVLEEAIAAESSPEIDEQQLVSEVLAQLAALEVQMAARGMDLDCTGSGVLPMSNAVDRTEQSLPLRKSA